MEKGVYLKLWMTSRCATGARGLGLWLVLWLCGASWGWGQELTKALSGPDRRVTSGTVVSIWVNAFNPSAAPATAQFPRELRGRLNGPGGNAEVVLPRVAATPDEGIKVAPQGFVRAEYSLGLPEKLAGKVVLELDGFHGSAVPLEIVPPEPVKFLPRKPPTMASEGNSSIAETRLETESDAVTYFKRHFYPHEPFYFVAGADSPNAKFQLSFKYQLVDDRSELAQHAGFVTNLFFAATQTSLWDWNSESAPFEDTSYKPEFMLQLSRLAHAGEDDHEWFRLGLHTGFMHESNGRDGDASRSLNIAYLSPRFLFGKEDGWQASLAPRFWVYLPDLENNRDLPRYRGCGDLRLVVGEANGLQLAAMVRVGDEFDKGSLQLDLTFPLRRIRWAGLTWCVQVQYFTGYGESLLHYNERSETIRAGFSIFR